jgi:hypothetical protein
MDIQEYNKFIVKVRHFFESKGFIEVPETTHTLTTTCEMDPDDLVLCRKNGMIVCLPQSNLKWIQYLLFNARRNGLFMTGISYNRGTMEDKKIHPILDFAAHGTIDDLLQILTDFCKYMDLGKPLYINPWGINILKDSECEKYKDKSSCIITNGLDKIFNKYFWQYKLVDTQYKVASLILYGKRIILGGERSTDINKMMFDMYTIDNGEYIKTLYNIYNMKHVDDELLRHPSIKWTTRYGATINLEALFNIINEKV